jgi:hypothetical protein
VGAFSALPHVLLLAILALLPADARLLCAAVCRAWRAAVKERSLWLVLDLTPASGVVARPMTPLRLRRYAALAGGQLQSLDVLYDGHVWVPELLAVVARNAATLTSLVLHNDNDQFIIETEQMGEVCRAGPQLLTFRVACAGCSAEEARSLLRNEPPFGPLRLQRLSGCPVQLIR